MAGHPAVRVDDDLAAGQAAVAHGAADHEPARGVDEQALLERPAVIHVGAGLGDDGLDHVLPQVFLDQRLGPVPVLG